MFAPYIQYRAAPGVEGGVIFKDAHHRFGHFHRGAARLQQISSVIQCGGKSPGGRFAA